MSFEIGHKESQIWDIITTKTNWLHVIHFKIKLILIITKDIGYFYPTDSIDGMLTESAFFLIHQEQRKYFTALLPIPNLITLEYLLNNFLMNEKEIY